MRAIPDPCLVIGGAADPVEFTEAVGTFRFDQTFKSSRYDRFPETLKILSTIGFSESPVVLDVAASDGSASLAVIESLTFSRYYLTDGHFEVVAQPAKSGTIFLDQRGEPIFHVGDWLVAYHDVKGAIWPFGLISKRLVSRSRRALCGERVAVSLINPRIRELSDPRIVVERYDVMTHWSRGRVDLVIAANIFNRSYFSDEQIVVGLRNIKNAMKSGGVLAIIENRASEQASIFRLMSGRFCVEGSVGAGADIRSLVESL